MANTIYSNEIIESRMTDLINTKLEVRSLMTVDNTLAESAGLRKTINRYTYNGSVELLAKGAANSAKGSVTYSPEYYDVKRYQQTFEYNDLDVMQDPYLLEAAMKGAAEVMSNQIKDEYFSELGKIGNRHPIAGTNFTYDDIVDALGALGREVEDDLFIIMGSDARSDLRRDPDFIAARQGEILYSGQFGTICGIPVLFSKKVPDGKMIITNKEAVRFFVKKEATVEQDRDIEKKDNTVVYERHGVIALIDDTASIVLGRGADNLTLTITASGGNASVKTAETIGSGNSYRFALNCDLPLLYDDLSHFEAWNGTSVIEAEAGDTIVIAEVNKDGLCVKSGAAVFNG